MRGIIDKSVLKEHNALVFKINNDGRLVEDAVRASWKLKNDSYISKCEVVLAIEKGSRGKCIGVFVPVASNRSGNRKEFHLDDAPKSLEDIYIQKYLPKPFNGMRNIHYIANHISALIFVVLLAIGMGGLSSCSTSTSPSNTNGNTYQNGTNTSPPTGGGVSKAEDSGFWKDESDMIGNLMNSYHFLDAVNECKRISADLNTKISSSMDSSMQSAVKQQCSLANQMLKQ